MDPKLVAAFRQMLRDGKKAPPINLGERTPMGGGSCWMGAGPQGKRRLGLPAADAAIEAQWRSSLAPL
jgi:hypothetical protein